MSDILPVCLQDILHSRKPDLREQISFNSKVNNDTHKRPFAQRAVICTLYICVMIAHIMRKRR